MINSKNNARLRSMNKMISGNPQSNQSHFLQKGLLGALTSHSSPTWCGLGTYLFRPTHPYKISRLPAQLHGPITSDSCLDQQWVPEP